MMTRWLGVAAQVTARSIVRISDRFFIMGITCIHRRLGGLLPARGTMTVETIITFDSFGVTAGASG